MKKNLFLLLAAIPHGVLAGVFDSFVSYRYGTNKPTELSGSFYDYEAVPEAPLSVDEAFAFTKSTNESIYVVHCYSMRKGLDGEVRSASVIWSELNFEATNEIQIGSAKDVKVVNFAIDAQI